MSEAQIIVHKLSKRVMLDLSNGQKMKSKVDGGIALAMHQIGMQDRREIRRLIRTGPKTGKKWPGLPNRSSKPFQAPAEQSGKLSKSAGFKVAGINLEVGLKAPYADFLESGTRRIRERPAILKAVHNNARNTQVALQKYVQNATKH